LDNVVADALSRKKDNTESLPEKIILNVGISWEKAKELGYYMRIDVGFLEEKDGE
jgi:hypothetical protein